METILRHFAALSKIPRRSGDEAAAADYILSYAKSRGCAAFSDPMHNVRIVKPAVSPAKADRTIMVQGHLDMVYVTEGSARYENGIVPMEQDGFLSAKGSSLGADNGIAAAYALRLLDLDDPELPNLEILLTAQEESGLQGAAAIHPSSLKSRTIINLDSEEEGVFVTGCAGGMDCLMLLPQRTETTETPHIPVTITLSGLQGGHSGMDIGREGGNAVVLAARLLLKLLNAGVKIRGVQAEGRANVIPASAVISAYVQPEAAEDLRRFLADAEEKFNRTLPDRLTISAEQGAPCPSFSHYIPYTVKSLVTLLLNCPNGVLQRDCTGQVLTSANVASVTEEAGHFRILTSVRSAFSTEKYALADKMSLLADAFGIKAVFHGDYPAWQPAPHSPLRETAAALYQSMFGVPPVLQTIHAGLECGIFSQKLPNADILSFGPTILDVHSVRERADVASIQRTWDFLLALLKRL